MSTPPTPPAGPLFTFRLACGLLGVLLAAMLAGLNNRVPELNLADISGALSLGHDTSTWLNTAYSAGELVAMPFSCWFAITFSLRRFHLTMLAGMLIMAWLMPLISDVRYLVVLRFFHGVFSGSLIPLLMMSALRFLPLPIRLHGLALYAMTATFTPNIALWLAALSADKLTDWRWSYWHLIPPGLLAILLVWWGIPKMPPMYRRLHQGNWFGMLLAVPGMTFLTIALDQGVRLEWFHSQVISASLVMGCTLSGLFLLSEWFHPEPFMRLQLLSRRNLGLGFSIFFILLIIFSSGVALPEITLGYLQGFRMEQSFPVGLIIGLPQLLLGSMVAMLLYQKWVDARKVFAIGLLFLTSSCYMGSKLTSSWMVQQFVLPQFLQTIGQPMTVVSLLFLATSVVHPMEGPSVAGIINSIRSFGTVFGSAFAGQILAVRQRFHGDMLLDSLGRFSLQSGGADQHVGHLASTIGQQAAVLATADLYRIFGILALVLVIPVLLLTYIPAPQVPAKN